MNLYTIEVRLTDVDGDIYHPEYEVLARDEWEAEEKVSSLAEREYSGCSVLGAEILKEQEVGFKEVA